MKKIKRVFRYFVLHSTRNTKYFFTYLIHFFDNNYVADIKYYDLDDLENLLKKGKSIIRIGDGEIYIMNFDGSNLIKLTDIPGDNWGPVFLYQE